MGIGTSAPAGTLHVITPSNNGSVSAWGTGNVVIGSAGTTGAGLGLSYSTTDNGGTAYLSALAPSVAWEYMGFRASNYEFYTNGATESMKIASTGVVTVDNLAGTGNRPVIASSTGALSTATGTNDGVWNVSANMLSSRDDIGGAAGLAMTTAVAAPTDDGSASVALPFTLYINGLACTYVSMCSNGFIQFNSSNSFPDGSPFSNTTLPSTTFSVPTVCFYWDDMVCHNAGIRYYSGGTAPNRIFVIDWDLITYTGSYEIVGQTAIHEGSNLINTTYATINAYACGQSATIGLQLNQTTAIDACYNTKVLDDNQAYDAEFISFAPSK